MITGKKVFQFFEGYIKLVGDKFDVLPKHIKEQVVYRSLICKDCMKLGQCAYCGCSVPGKLYVEKSCNKGKRFPNLMNETKWNNFKATNNIQIK